MTEKHLDIASETLARKQHFLKLAIQQLVRAGGIATVQADYLRRLLAAMKMDADFTILPGQTSVFMKEDVSPAQGLNVLTFKTALGYNFDRLEDVEAIICDAMDGKLYGGLDEAMSSLEKLSRRANPFGQWVHPVGWCIIGFMTTVLLGGRFIEGAASAFAGLVFGLALLTLDMVPALGFSFDFWISFVVALILALTQAFIIPSLAFWPAFLASVILILPGFSMSMGFTDVFSKNTVFGLTTLFNAGFTALSIAVGAFLGVRSAAVLAMRSIEPIAPWEYKGNGYPDWIQFVLYPFFNLFLNATFQAKPMQCATIAPLASLGFGIYVAGYKLGLTDEGATLTACFFMGLLGQIYGRLTKRSELPTVFSGVIVFAPGTFGARCFYYGLEAAAKGDSVAAIYALKQGASMLTISASIALGILLSRLVFGRT